MSQPAPAPALVVKLTALHTLDADQDQLPHYQGHPAVADRVPFARFARVVVEQGEPSSPWPRVRLQWAAADPSRQPGQFISHYVGHEGPGSILEQLKKLGWATSLSSSASNGAAGFEFFRININLSATGLGASLIVRA